MISFSQPLWTDEVNALLPGFNMTEIEDNDSACNALVELVWRYNCIMGDLEPVNILGSDVLQKHMFEKFSYELGRMQDAVDLILVSDEIEQSDNPMAVDLVKEDFSSFKSSLMLIMRCNPLGTREWLQHFEMYMTCAAARRGLGYIEFVLY